jgi:hypothetical protein
MAKTNITIIEGLAELIHETMASKEDIKELRTEMNQQFEGVNSMLVRTSWVFAAFDIAGEVRNTHNVPSAQA